MKLNFKKLSDTAILPKYAHDDDSGFDLHADLSEPVRIGVGDRAVIKTGIAPCLVKGQEIQIRPRSGLALKYGITVLNTPGTIDAGYTGEIQVILLNTDLINSFTVKHGDKIAQGVLCSVINADIQEISEINETERGDSGFGSSGI